MCTWLTSIAFAHGSRPYFLRSTQHWEVCGAMYRTDYTSTTSMRVYIVGWWRPRSAFVSFLLSTYAVDSSKAEVGAYAPWSSTSEGERGCAFIYLSVAPLALLAGV